VDRTKQLVAGVVVLAALGGAVWKVAQDDAKKGSATITAADLPDLKATDDVDKISITNGEKGEVVLEKKGDKWEVTKPVKAAAAQANVKSLLDNLKELKVKEIISTAPTDETKKEFQFEPGKAVKVVTFKGADKKLDASFGKSGARGQMAMVEGKPSIYSVSGYSSYLYAREVKGWRDTKIFEFDDANVVGFAVENKNGPFSFTKGEKWAGTFKGKAIERFDEEKVKDALRALKTLNADDFGDGKSAAETALDAPEGKATVTLKDGAGTYVLKIGKTSSGTSRYAIKDGSEVVYTVSQYPTDWVLADMAKFQKPDPKVDAGAPKGPPGMPPGMGGMGGMGGMPPGMGDPHGMGGDPHGH
jgi:hypothetical protein